MMQASRLRVCSEVTVVPATMALNETWDSSLYLGFGTDFVSRIRTCVLGDSLEELCGKRSNSLPINVDEIP